MSVSARERLRGKFVHLLASHGTALEPGSNPDQAIALYFRGIGADPVVEVFHQGLMRCYQAQGRHTEAIAVFRRLRTTLAAVLSVQPAAPSRLLYDISLKACNAAA